MEHGATTLSPGGGGLTGRLLQSPETVGPWVVIWAGADRRGRARLSRVTVSRSQWWPADPAAVPMGGRLPTVS
eukprot:4610209-Lingulodinium_polyedra.AAC.1